VKSAQSILVNKNMKLKQRVGAYSGDPMGNQTLGTARSFMPPPGLSTTLCASSFH
jgi:hypothetical protein